ncbi:MAG: heme-dependent oxidative N-demethylase family protein [Janthinobacterium lividum]
MTVDAVCRLTGLPAEALYLPFDAGPHRMMLGLVSRPEDELVELDERYPAELAERRTLLDHRHAEVFAATAGSELARQETLDRLTGLLPERYPIHFRRDGDLLCNRLTGESWNLADPPHDPLELAGRLIQEDLCLIGVEGGVPVLRAAVLCAPSRWRLHEKIGRPLADIHDRVPLYAGALAAPVDRFMRHLKPGKLTERLNWSVTDDPALFQVEGKHRTGLDPSFTAANAGERLFLRVERQTLSRLPRSGFVLFTIRVHTYPLSRVAAQPGAAARLAGAVRAMPEAMAAYKSLPPFRAALLGFLDESARGRVSR